MFRAAWALTGSREDAEDLVQDTFTKVLSRPRVVRGDERGYLLQALRNTFYTRVRTASTMARARSSIAGTSRHPRTIVPLGSDTSEANSKSSPNYLALRRNVSVETGTFRLG